MITQEQIRRARAIGKGQPFFFQKSPAISFSAGQAYHTFQTAGGIPSAGAYGALLAPIQFIGAKAAPSHNGLILFDDAIAPEENFLTFLKIINASTNGSGMLHIIDMLVEYGGFTGGSVIAQPTGVAVGGNNLPRYTDGEGVYIMPDVTAAFAAAVRTLTVSYTDQNGNAGVTPSVNTIASCPQSKILHTPAPFLPLAALDRGVKSIQSLTFGAPPGAGTVALLLVKLLASIPIVSGSFLGEGDFVNLQPMLPKLEDDACISFLFMPSTTNTPVLSGTGEALALDPDDLDA